MLRVIDISDYQKDDGLDLNAIADKFDAVMIKATGGNGYVNPSCDYYFQQAVSLGKKVGVYHYFSDGYNDSDPIAEANWFVDNCLGYIGKAIFAEDWERGGNPDVGNSAMARQFTQQVKARIGYNAGDYMSLSLVTGLDWSGSISDGNWLWCADYVEDNTPIINFGMDTGRDPNPNWDGQVNDVMWQFTSTGRLDGYSGNLDCSFFYGTQATWDAYAGTHTAAPQPAPTQPETPSEPTPAPVPVPEPVPVPFQTPTDPTPQPVPEPTPEPTPNPEPVPAPTPSPTTPSTQWYQVIWKLIVEFIRKLKIKK